jgi:(E)-4-hydroxy-3-methylbut-2-enyl-diphosphate synthase
MNRFTWSRRPTRAVPVGSTHIGGKAPILVQSMCTTPTRNVAATVAQAIRLAEAGCELVRVTAPGVKDAQALAAIRQQFSQTGFAHIPLCADIHFMPAAALEAVEHVEKVRINPGNYADKKSFQQHDYSDSDYQAELERVRERLLPLVRRAKQLGRALRIGTNHGSLSDRIVNRYGDTPLGMVASAEEFLGICEGEGFRDIVLSMKASNVKVMMQSYRLLAQRLHEQGRDYPLHLGVTEAGDGEDARAKSAAGIGGLLEDGLGDTIRVSLTEDPVHEIPVAQALRQRYQPGWCQPPRVQATEAIDPMHYTRRPSLRLELAGQRCGGGLLPLVITPRQHAVGDPPADLIAEALPQLLLLDIPAEAPDTFLRQQLPGLPDGHLLGIDNPGPLNETRAYRLLAAILAESQRDDPICLALPRQADPLALAAITGGLLVDGIGDAIFLPTASDPRATAFTILQAVRARITRTDYVACPSCGRTLFDLEEVTAHIKAATNHLQGVTIAVMGCIVNGPGEMADADFGYVGSGPGKITLYRGQQAVLKNIPQAEARDRLIQLIKDSGRWQEPSL